MTGHEVAVVLVIGSVIALWVAMRSREAQLSGNVMVLVVGIVLAFLAVGLS